MKNKYLLTALLLAGATLASCTNEADNGSSSQNSSEAASSDVANSESSSDVATKKELPDPFKEDADGTFSATDSNVTATNFAEYANRSDVRYIDLRNSTDYVKSHLHGFEMVEFFATIYDGSADHSGTQLFYKDSTTGLFVPRYAESVETLKEILPTDKALFLMCQSGGRVAVCMQIMAQFGWDMSHVYNIGGMNNYGDSAFRVDNLVLADATLASSEILGTAVTSYTKLVEELPYPAAEDKRTTYSASDSAINSTNLDTYAEREDVTYIDLRNTADYVKSHLAGFEMVEFFATIYDGSADHSGTQLFYKNAESKYVARYTDSVETLKEILPQDKTLFLMCQSGGRVAVCMQIMAQFGWDMGHVYNVGGMNQYAESKYRVDNLVLEDATTKTYVPHKGLYEETSFGATYNTIASVITDETGKIAYLAITGHEVSASDVWPSNTTWTSAKSSFLAKFVGKTLADISACIDTDNKVVAGSDIVTGATLSSKRVYLAVINALTPAE